MKHKLVIMLYAVTASHLSLGIVYVLIDYFELNAYILGYFIALAWVELFVVIQHQRSGDGFGRMLHFEPDKPDEHKGKVFEDALYDYFVICLKRGERPGKRNWLGRSIPSHPNITITPSDWRHCARHARYDGYLKYGGRGIGYISLVAPPTSPKTSLP